MNEESLDRNMTPILLEDLGMRFATDKSKRAYRYGLYQCQYCRKNFETVQYYVRRGGIKSCGCQSDKYRNPHGMRKHRLYGTWRQMKARCYNPKHKCYIYYGARGIKVCDRWLDIRNFIEDMYPSWEEGLTLDRIEVNGDYEPNNCRWATTEIQTRNTRDIICTNKSGYRGVSWKKRDKIWTAQISVDNNKIYLGNYNTAIEAAKAYETYVRVNNLEHNFTPVLTEEEIKNLIVKEKK